ncbi:MAG TPA: hypothetical protein VFN30_03530 [Chitinophagaceae bacterium]|nr:hypothetical protein [Chitinophagaceae bacterium]
MNKIVAQVLILLLLVSSCRKIEVDGGTVVNSPTSENTVLSGVIRSDITLREGNTYLLRGIVYVTDGAVLTIEAGTTILGDKSSRGALIITRGSRIEAKGTANKPIVFTSSELTSPKAGDWGGLVLLGRAKTNATFNGTSGLGEAEGGINNGDGYGLYGGADDNDNSGTLQYVRIEYAGYAFLPDKELNGLSMYAVGRGTKISYIEVLYAADDSFEWFGGTVNCDHLIAYKGLDDEFDTDNGFNGKVQFGIGIRDSAIADVSGSNGFESDNDAAGSMLTPGTAAVFANITLVGPRQNLTNMGNALFRNAAQIRRNSSLSVFNSVFLGWPTGLLIDASTGRPTDLNITSDNTLKWAGNIIAGSSTPLKYSASSSAPTGWTLTDFTNWYNMPELKNTTLATTADAGYAGAFNYTNPDFSPLPGSAVLNAGIDYSDPKLTGFTAVSYRGAVGTNDTWYKGWTRFPQ